MTRVTAELVVDGPRQLLRALRKRVVDSLASEGAAVQLTESHQEDRLQFKLSAEHGMPYPQLIAASAMYPDCVLSMNWQSDGKRGLTTIRAGEVQVASGESLAGGELPQAIEVDADGCLLLGIVVAGIGGAGATTGFAATRAAETYFSIAGDDPGHRLATTGGGGLHWDEHWQCDLAGAWRLDADHPARPIEEGQMRQLEAAAAAFRARWLWYDQAPPEDTAIERARAAAADRRVCAINVQSRALAGLGKSRAFDSIAAVDCGLVPLLRRTWAATDL